MASNDLAKILSPQIVLTLKVDPKAIEDYFLEALSGPNGLLQKFSDKTHRSLTKLTRQVKELTRDIFTKSEMIRGLLEGDLAGQFGLPAGTHFETADRIIEIIVKNVYVDAQSFRLNGRQIKGGLKIQISNEVYDDLMGAGFAEIETAKGVILPWINWSLTKGDDIIIGDYRFFLKHGKGRSNLGIMVASNNGGTWKVPSEVSGTLNDNWVSREIKLFRDEYLTFVNNALSEIFNSIL